jgi:catechol 2,3-dioxygenase-like lactoylglutathione lyase family enzyme
MFAGTLFGALLLTPLWNAVPSARLWLVVLGLPALAPWRALYHRLLERSTRRGVAALAEEWGGAVVEDPELGLFTAERSPGSHGAPAGDDTPAGHRTPAGPRREAWVGNALTEIRSLHPAVATRDTERSLAFVVRLEREPPLECALVRGRDRFRYHTREWRVDYAAQGAIFGMSMGDLLTEGFRETGGAMDRLAPIPEDDLVALDPRLADFHTVLTSDDDAFRATFVGDLLADLLELAPVITPFELNVTPTSVNILTGYTGEEVQRRCVAWLDRLAEQLLER